MTSAMSEYFDPYYKWLAIPPEEQPPHHYRLLGALQRFENDPDVIATAADQRMAHLRTFQAGKHGAISQQLLNEVATARVCLLNPTRKAAYDQQLQASLQPQAPAPPRAPIGPPAGRRSAPGGASHSPPYQPNVPIPVRTPAPIPSVPVATADRQFDSSGGQMDSDPSIASTHGGHRSRKKKQASMGAIGPLIAVGAIAAVALVAYLASSQPDNSQTPTVTQAYCANWDLPDWAPLSRRSSMSRPARLLRDTAGATRRRRNGHRRRSSRSTAGRSDRTRRSRCAGAAAGQGG